MAVQQSTTASRAMSFLPALPSQDASPLAARTLFCANTCAAFCSKPFGERREATGLLSSATRERLQKCFNNFPDICCNIQQLGARASALTSLPHPRGGNVCMCWQPCGRFSVGPLFRFMHLRLVFFFFMRKELIYLFCWNIDHDIDYSMNDTSMYTEKAGDSFCVLYRSNIFPNQKTLTKLVK